MTFLSPLGPYNRPSVVPVKLTNTCNQVIAYKVKTTAPKMYSVLPTHGFVQPKADAEITITLTVPSAELDTFATKNRHKFLVQIAYGPQNDLIITPEAYWKENRNAVVSEHKFRCVFDKIPSDQIDKSNSRTADQDFKSFAPDDKLPSSSPKSKDPKSIVPVSVVPAALASDNQNRSNGRQIALYAGLAIGAIGILVAYLHQSGRLSYSNEK